MPDDNIKIAGSFCVKRLLLWAQVMIGKTLFLDEIPSKTRLSHCTN